MESIFINVNIKFKELMGINKNSFYSLHFQFIIIYRISIRNIFLKIYILLFYFIKLIFYEMSFSGFEFHGSIQIIKFTYNIE